MPEKWHSYVRLNGNLFNQKINKLCKIITFVFILSIYIKIRSTN
jgi:hypothetical protein